MTLSALSDALSLPLNYPAPPRAPYLVYRGHLMSLHHDLDAARVVHELLVHPETGMAVVIAGLVTERGELGGVVVIEAVPPIAVTESSGNVFADLGLPDADELLRASEAAIQLDHP